MNVIDSHVHFWKYDSENPEFDWISDGMESIKKSFLPQNLITTITSDFKKQNYQYSTVNYSCIAIQAAETWQETEFLLDLASKNDFIKGVVGWIDFQQLSTLNYQISTKLKGFRHIIQSKPQGFMSDDKFRYFISKLKNQNYTYDLLVKPHQLEEALDLVQEFPNQKFVIDHLAKPDIRNQDFIEWKKDIEQFKNLPNVYCKVSGMVTEANWQTWKESDFENVLDVVFNTFGTERLMYGSDWSVCLLAADYQQVLGIVANYVSSLSIHEQEKILAKNAMKFYNIQI